MVQLRKVDAGNVWEILALHVADAQKHFVAPNDRSIIEAYLALTSGGHAFPFGIYDGDTPVGFLMIGYDVDDTWQDAPAIAYGTYNIWRLMIDSSYQHRGYGRQALQLALDFIRTYPCGTSSCVWLSYEPENAHARALYHSFGFRETGEKDGDEIIAAMAL